MTRQAVDIPLDRCRPSPTARPVLFPKVLVLAASIKDIGLRQPINVRPMGADFEIRGGGHRADACRHLGWTTIPAFVTEDNDLIAELAEIDENLIRNELSPAERAIAISRRKAVYEALHPEAAHGGARKSSRQLGDLIEPNPKANDAERFTKTTAEATGKSERSVQRDAQRGDEIGAEALTKIVNTSLDKGEELDALARMAPDRREQLIARAVAGEDVSAKDYIGGAASRAVNARRHEPDDSLDYFPTPPYATRALFERVLPTIGITSVTSVREPACGEGHIASVAGEYCADVRASDIFDYGYGDVQDYLSAEAAGEEWIITNPPFNLALEFVMRARQMASRGVAVFVRSQWAVEGIERYETLFRDSPPTLCAFFVERVPLCKGQWDPKVSSAMAYAWLVWVHGEPPRPPLWIPPGCRVALSKPDDIERFTAHPVIKRAPVARTQASSSPIDSKGKPIPHDEETGEVV